MSSQRRVAVITGAASGIGLALAKTCVKRGFDVVIADNNQRALEDTACFFKQELEQDVLAVACDVRERDDLIQLAEKCMHHFKRIDWLFNNAGISGSLAPIWELTDAEIRRVMDVNLHGIIYGIQAFLPFMFQQDHRSQIINIASLYGLCSGSQMGAYAMSKHAVVALSESLYFDLQRLKKPVDVSVACPSFVNTQLLADHKQTEDNALHAMLNDLLARSRPAVDVAEYIVHAVLNHRFYILPDKEVKNYCEQRNSALIEEGQPHVHSIEKIISRLSQRASQNSVPF